MKSKTPCTVEIAHTSYDFYAHVELKDNTVGPGDQVLVHNAPVAIDYGQHIKVDREATISRASWLSRFWTKFIARFELTTLYEVSFSTTRFTKSRRYPRPSVKIDGRLHTTTGERP
jgi:hypothetical protein